MKAPEPDFTHLLHMTDDRGTFEHALLDVARTEHGYCTDDMARVLAVATREPHPTAAILALTALSLRFLSDAQTVDGRYRNRMNSRGRWTDRPTLDDCWGRSIFGLGTAAGHSRSDWVRQSATAQFERAAQQRSPFVRAMAFAAVGAAEILRTDPANRAAHALITDAADSFAPQVGDSNWPWPEPRLSYANATITEAMIAAGVALARPDLVEQGLRLLGWLLDIQTVDGKLSVIPVGGAAEGDRRPWFDQQPIEVAAIADACARATTVDGDARWSHGVAAAVDWFLGANDADCLMWDPGTGAGFDGLHAHGVNLNRGAESTLALLSTLQHARHLVSA